MNNSNNTNFYFGVSDSKIYICFLESEKKIKKFKKYRFIPETNIKLNQTEEINKVCPISGCRINKIKIGKTMHALKKNLK